MKTNMRLTTVAAALLIVLAGAGIASAATITLSIAIADNQLEVGDTTTYSIYGMVTNNVVVDPYDFSFAGGIASFQIDQVFTSSNGGAIRHLQAAGPPSTTSAGTTVALATNVAPAPIGPFAAKNNGTIRNEAWVATALGTGGVDNTYGAQAPGGGYDYYNGGRFLYGSEEPALLFVGTYKAVTNGRVDIDLLRGEIGSCLVWYVDGETLKSKVAEEVVFAGAGQTYIQVGPTGPTNTLPTVAITAVNGAAPDPAGILETDWDTSSGGIGWNDPGHFVDVTAVGIDGESDPLTYKWTMTKPGVGGGSLALTGLGTNGQLHLTLADIASLGLPPMASGGEIWTLSVLANDGTGDSVTPATIPVFVPEPATMGLLAFGVFGLLKRRRRA